jgi:4-hydroxy-3-polyprenylbenzoate decarboxylase
MKYFSNYLISMKYRDLRDFLAQLEQLGQLRRVADPVSPRLEMTAIGRQLLRAGGPAVLFTQPTGHRIPVLINLFGTPNEWPWAWGRRRRMNCATWAGCWRR